MRIWNLIDQLIIIGGFWKEQRQRRLECLIRHSVKVKTELEQMEQDDTDLSEQSKNEDKFLIDFVLNVKVKTK